MLTLFALDTPMFSLALPGGTPIDPILEMKAKEEKNSKILSRVRVKLFRAPVEWMFNSFLKKEKRCAVVWNLVPLQGINGEAEGPAEIPPGPDSRY